MLFDFQDEGHQRKWLDGRMYEIPADSVVSLQPTATFDCSAQRGCIESDKSNIYPAIWKNEGKCSALLTREGFFDFVVFRTKCDAPYNVTVVCQHDRRTNAFLHNNMSDIKISTVGGGYSLQVFSSCGAGWFLVDNVCVNLYYCPDCSNNMAAHEKCVKHGGQLANRVLNNVTITAPGNTLGKNTQLSLFWGMFHHMDDISPSPRETFKSFLNVVKEPRQKHVAVNGSDLCEALNMSKHCIGSDIVLSLKYNDISLDRFAYKTLKTPYPLVRISNANHYVPPWSVIHQPVLQMAINRQFTLCEKPSHAHTLMSDWLKCSEVFMSCNDGTCVHDSLVCDGKPHCPDGKDENDCLHICSDHKHSCMSQCHHRDLCSCSPEYFQCLSGGCVPLQKLCDKIVHCVDASDEPPTCVYLRPEQIGHQSLTLDINIYINKLIQQNIETHHICLHSNNEPLPPGHNVEYKMHSHQHRCSTYFLPKIKFYCSMIGTPHITSQQYFSLDRLYMAIIVTMIIANIALMVFICLSANICTVWGGSNAHFPIAYPLIISAMKYVTVHTVRMKVSAPSYCVQAWFSLNKQKWGLNAHLKWLH